MAILQVICPDIQGFDGAKGIGGQANGTTPVVDTANKYSPFHRASWKCVAPAGGQSAVDLQPPPTALGNSYGLRWKQMFQALPGSTGAFSFMMQMYSGGTPMIAASNDNANKMRLYAWQSGSGAQVGSVSAASLVVGQFHVFDVVATIPASGVSSVSFYMDGVLVGTSSSLALNNTAIDEIAVGCTFNGGGSGSITTNVADIMAWDSTGIFPFNVKPLSLTASLKLHLPVGDGTNVGWKDGLTATSPLTPAISHLPPVGVISASATTTSQITDATSNTTDNYTAVLQSPVQLGIGSTDTIQAAIVVTSLGNSTTTPRSIGVSGVVPAITEVTPSTSSTAAGTWPTGWTPSYAAISVLPTVADVTAPLQAKVRKATASTDQANVANLGMIIVHVPGAPAGGLVVKKAHGGAWV